MKKIGLILLSFLMLVGCSQKPAEVTSTPEVEPNDTTSDTLPNAMICGLQNEGIMMQNTFIVENSEVARLEQVITYTISEETDVEGIKSSIQADQEKKLQEEGVNFVMEETDKEIITTITYDLNKVSEAILVEINLTDDQKTDGKFDLTKIRNTMIEMNASCQGF